MVLDNYFERIGYGGPVAARLDILRALQALHVASIPFEAIDVMLDRPIDLRPEAVAAKLIDDRRGGYCFEQNGLFRRVLETIGFEVEVRLARVLWMASADAPAGARSHMVLRVHIDGVAWLVDVGFGSAVPTAPLRWDDAAAQATPFGNFRLTATQHGHRVETDLTGEWSPTYQVSAEPPEEIDLEVANWFTSTHPASHFRRRLMVTRTLPDRRVALLGPRLTIRPRIGEPSRVLLNVARMQEALVSIFGLPDRSDWIPMLERAVETEAEP